MRCRQGSPPDFMLAWILFPDKRDFWLEYPKYPLFGEREGSRASRLRAIEDPWRLRRAALDTLAPDSTRETRVSRPLSVNLALGCCDMGWPSLP